MPHTADQSFDLIKAAHQRNRLAHAFLITGALGAGKENLASRIISLLNAPTTPTTDLFGDPIPKTIPPLDQQEGNHVRIIRPLSKSRIIKIEQIRDLEHTLQLAAPRGQTKVATIVDADRMTDQASNAFLKTLEEPPANSLLLLLTTKPNRLLPTILSRCVNVKLLGGQSLSAEGGQSLINALNQAASNGIGDPITALQLKAVFSSFLDSKKDETEAAAKAALKDEVTTYRDSTDGSWLKERETFHNAAATADYLEARNRYIDILLAWLADLLRIKSGATGLDFPDSAQTLAKIAENESIFSITKRLEALEKLRATLETNASEPIALDVGFLKAFA